MGRKELEIRYQKRGKVWYYKRREISHFIQQCYLLNKSFHLAAA